MENDFFLNAGIPPPLHFEQTSSMPAWRSSFSTVMDIQAAAADSQNCSPEQSPDCFYNPNWEKSTDQSIHFESALSSMVSSPNASNSNISNESFVIRELIGKLGNIGNSGEISPHSQTLLGIQANSYMGTKNGNAASTNTSCYSTPLNSPPKLSLPIMDHHLKKENLPALGKSMALNSSVAEFSADPGFAERAAKFSCFGSRSFNGRTTQLGINNSNNSELAYRSNPVLGNGKLPRVSSSPSLKALGSQYGVPEKMNSLLQDRNELPNSREETTVSEQNTIGETGLVASNSMDLNSRKRKSVPKGKASKEQPPPISQSPTSTKVAEVNDNSNAKRSKPNENKGIDQNGSVKAEEDTKGGSTSSGGDEKQTKNGPKPPEPHKDYIHVRARRGQATDSHSLAERVRREKISERMKLLQDLVPGCNKVTGKALMLDEIINYVQSLQRQVEFLSMKLSSVNTRLDFNMETLMSKEIFQQNNSLLQHPIFPLDSSAQPIYGHQRQQNPALQSNISNGAVDPLDNTTLCQSLGMQLPPLSGFSEGIIPQYQAFGEDDLQTIVQMGFGQNPNRESELHGSDQISHMKIEL